MSVSLAIQAGGQSSRMGQNKALMSFQGQSLVERISQRLAPAADEIILISNQPDELAFLGKPVHKDIWIGKGPLGGLHTALTVAKYSLVAIVACDLPFASLDLLRFELDQIEKDGWDAAIPLISGKYEPLHAVYRKETCLPAVIEAVKQERFKLVSWLPAVKVRNITEDEVRKIDDKMRMFINVNTPEEFLRATLLEG